MAYRKIVSGVANQSNETASHNKISIEPGYAGTYLVLFVCILITGSIIFMWVAHSDILAALVAGTFIGVFVTAWIYAIQFVRRDISRTTTEITVNQHIRERAQLESHVAAMTENFILYKDENGQFRFQGTVQLTENRHYPAQIEAPVNQQDIILTMYDKGSSARAIERHLKDKKVSYYEIQKVLNLYRPEWNKKVIESEQAYEE